VDLISDGEASDVPSSGAAGSVLPVRVLSGLIVSDELFSSPYVDVTKSTANRIPIHFNIVTVQLLSIGLTESSLKKAWLDFVCFFIENPDSFKNIVSYGITIITIYLSADEAFIFLNV